MTSCGNTNQESIVSVHPFSKLFVDSLLSDALNASRARSDKLSLEATQPEALLLSRQLARVDCTFNFLVMKHTLHAVYMNLYIDCTFGASKHTSLRAGRQLS